MTRPTKDLDMAILRLRRSAEHLICRAPGKYGGSIVGDIEAVLQALEKARAIDAVDPSAADPGKPTPRDE